MKNGWRGRHFAALAFAITLIPDLDFVPGVLLGDPGLYHRGATHSFAGAFLLSAPIAALLAALVPGESQGPVPRFLRWYVFVVPVYSAHLFLDLLSPDTVHNSGLRLLWPFTDAYFMAPLPVPESLAGFFDLEFGPDSAGFFRTMFSGHALAVYLAEALIFSPLMLLPVVTSHGRKRSEERGSQDGAPGRRVEADRQASRRRRNAGAPRPADAAG